VIGCDDSIADHYGGIAKALKTLCVKSQAMQQRFGRIAAAGRDGLQAAQPQQELEQCRASRSA
jgi:hypothetical protein